MYNMSMVFATRHGELLRAIEYTRFEGEQDFLPFVVPNASLEFEAGMDQDVFTDSERGYPYQKSTLIGIASSVSLVVYFMSIILTNMNNNRNVWSVSIPVAKLSPLIVMWTDYTSNHTGRQWDLTSALKGCDYQCDINERKNPKFHNRSASAYLLHGSHIDLLDLPEQSSHYLIVLLTKESPIRLKSWGQLYRLPPNYFNATMTYRRDARYSIPYGQFLPRTAKDPSNSIVTQKQLLEALKIKTRGSLIVISNCYTPSLREETIRELGRFTEITVRGKCEKLLSVNDSLKSANCKSDCSDADLIATHRFYIAFENSICGDYITEKFYSRISHLLVPIVLNRRIYLDAGIPPHSFIAVDDFKSLEDLGTYMNYLRKNNTAYLRHFDWTQHFRKPNPFPKNAFCKLCEDIHNKERLIVKDIRKHFGPSQCLL